MTDPVTIETPPEPWVNAPASMTPDGAGLELVELAAVVRWLMTAKRLHFVPAVHAMHKAMTGLEGVGLYFTDGKGLAHAVGAADAFGLDIPRGRRIFNRGIDMPRPEPIRPQPLPDGVTPGVSAALYMVLHQPNEPDAWISRLAMPCEQAAQLWSVAELQAAEPELLTFDALVKTPQLRKNAKGYWFPEAKKVVQAEIDRVEKSGGRGLISVATALNLTATNISTLLNRVSKTEEKSNRKAAELAREHGNTFRVV